MWRMNQICDGSRVHFQGLHVKSESTEGGWNERRDMRRWREPHSRESIPTWTQWQWIQTWNTFPQTEQIADCYTHHPINCKMLLLPAHQGPSPFPGVQIKPASANTWLMVMHPFYLHSILFILHVFDGDGGEREPEAAISMFQLFHSWLTVV